MALRSGVQFAVLCFLLAGMSSCLFAQATNETKEAAPAGSPYSAEQRGTVTPQLTERESVVRAELAQHTDSPELLYSLALILREEGKTRESLDTYTRAAKYSKPTAEELRSVALDYVLLNDYDEAIHWLEVAVQMDPDNAEALYALGRCYYTKDRYLDAAKMYERVLVIQPKNLKAEENLGLVYDAINRPEMAEDALRNAAGWADADGKDEWPFLDLGGFLLDRDRAKEAVDPLRIAVHIRPECAACHEKLGRALLAVQNNAAGLAELEQATKLDPRNPKIHYEFGHALRRLGQNDRAQQELALSRTLYSAHSQE
jgi:tetratricopeptide (TPR) repeat protein